VLAANAVLSFAYTKDDIMSVAGVFYAFAAFVATREALATVTAGAFAPAELRRPKEGPPLRNRAAIVLLILLIALSAAWSVRAVGVHYLLRSQAIKHQNDWAHLPHTWRREGRWPTDAAADQLIRDLRRDAIDMTLPNTREGRPEWADRLWTD